MLRDAVQHRIQLDKAQPVRHSSQPAACMIPCRTSFWHSFCQLWKPCTASICHDDSNMSCTHAGLAGCAPGSTSTRSICKHSKLVCSLASAGPSGPCSAYMPSSDRHARAESRRCIARPTTSSLGSFRDSGPQVRCSSCPRAPQLRGCK